MTVASWNVGYHLSLIYKANRKRSEWMFFTPQSDVQPIITDPLGEGGHRTDNAYVEQSFAAGIDTPQLVESSRTAGRLGRDGLSR